MSSTAPHGTLSTVDELDWYPFGVDSGAAIPVQTVDEHALQLKDAAMRLRAIAERRIIANGGRDGAGDVIYRNGRPHPAHHGRGLPWMVER